MAKIILADNEYTMALFVEYLNKKHGGKQSSLAFTRSDAAQYLQRGYLPFRYGGNIISSEVIKTIQIITISKKKAIVNGK